MSRTSAVSPLLTNPRKFEDPRGGNPTRVVSIATASMTVSRNDSDSPEQSAGQAAPLSSRSPHAARPRAAVIASSQTDHLCKPSTPSFDVETVDDRHDHGIDRAVLGDRGLPCRASCCVEDDLTDAGT